MKTAAFIRWFLLPSIILGISGSAGAAERTNQPSEPPHIVHFTNAPSARTRDASGGMASVLTEEQRDSFRKATEAQRDQVRELGGKMMTARRELDELTWGTKFNEASIREKAAELAKIEADMVVLRAKAFAQIEPPLSSEQIEKLKRISSATSGRGIDAGTPPKAPGSASTNRDENGLPPKQ